ncbi:MAG: peptide deformylase [Clostridia bacterium]|nr:peptide deformylase [Clostridia bacterium]
MAILKIINKKDPILRKKSRPVEEITPRIIRLLDDMKDTLHKAEGAGLAAVQVGVLRRIVLVETEKDELLEMINPEIIYRSEERQQNIEGCLSIPNEWGITDRPMTVTVRAQNRNGEWYEVTGSELKARAFCHELDHLDGILYTDNVVRMLDEDELG